MAQNVLRYTRCACCCSRAFNVVAAVAEQHEYYYFVVQVFFFFRFSSKKKKMSVFFFAHARRVILRWCATVVNVAVNVDDVCVRPRCTEDYARRNRVNDRLGLRVVPGVGAVLSRRWQWRSGRTRAIVTPTLASSPWPTPLSSSQMEHTGRHTLPPPPFINTDRDRYNIIILRAGTTGPNKFSIRRARLRTAVYYYDCLRHTT